VTPFFVDARFFEAILNEYPRGNFRRESVDEAIMILIHNRTQYATLYVYFVDQAFQSVYLFLEFDIFVARRVSVAIPNHTSLRSENLCVASTAL
jgi:hypothetical protein